MRVFILVPRQRPLVYCDVDVLKYFVALCDDALLSCMDILYCTIAYRFSSETPNYRYSPFARLSCRSCAIPHILSLLSAAAQDEGKRELRSFDRMPNFIHYCHMYRVGQWLFNKR